MNPDRAWQRAVEQSFVVRFPKQHLSTFGFTNIAYYVVTEPIYREMVDGGEEGVVRTGRVIAERPAVITPTYAMNLKGFSDEAYEYLQDTAQQYGPNSPGILYQYKNEAEKSDIVSGAPSEIAHRISDDLDRRSENMAVVMVGVDELWDIALLKFIYEFTSSSSSHNVQDLNSRGLLEPQPSLGGVPRAAVEQIERLFGQVERGGDSDLLKRELDRWGLFDFYQDRFLRLFRGQRRRS
jgi:hypothetical protein